MVSSSLTQASIQPMQAGLLHVSGSPELNMACAPLQSILTTFPWPSACEVLR